MRIKHILGQVHLWIGVVLGILFFIVAFSGAVYTWVPEMSAIVYKKKVESRDEPFVSVSTLKKTMDREFPKGDFRTAFYKDNSSTLEVLLYGQGTYYIAQVNPYSGELVHLQDMNKGWLNYIKFIHRNLMLGDIGRQIVHWTTLLFLVMMITGMVLWWPVNRTGRKQRFTIKWGASPKKLNYDLHNVLGFYATWVSIFTVITGLFWGFDIMKSGLKAITGENKMVYDIPESNEDGIREPSDQFALLDSLALVFRNRYPSKFVRVSSPHEKTEAIRVVVIDPDMLVYNTNHFYFDRYSGKQIKGHFENGLHREASMFHTLHGLVYDVHFGNILSFPGRLLVFFASLISASLPITGFIVWLGKRKKSKIGS